MKEKLLVVVDMQNDFIAGSLGTAEAQAIVEPVCEKIAGWDGDVFVTLDTHETNYLDTAEGAMLPVPHCIRGTEGHRLHADVARQLDAFSGSKTVFEKPTFGSVEMCARLAQSGYEEVVFIGLCTDICVLSNAIMARAALPEAEISVDAACCAGVTPPSHTRALEAMAVCNIKTVSGTK